MKRDFLLASRESLKRLPEKSHAPHVTRLADKRAAKRTTNLHPKQI
jgi:hypothetical protein